MKKYRIVEEICDKDIYFMPQKKTLFGWKYFDGYTLTDLCPYDEALECIKNDEDAKVAFAKGDRILIV